MDSICVRGSTSGPMTSQAPPPRSSEGELELQRGGARALAPPIWLCSEHPLLISRVVYNFPRLSVAACRDHDNR
ncbi:hypothetical protein QQF64_034845 [Cirrhinus molitorella]|uniref:Uncharacterized protein n=1 Tax=Cirrhinus molitorella TaxID=172907 RepID=A0ABR3L5H9_9TELE